MFKVKNFLEPPDKGTEITFGLVRVGQNKLTFYFKSFSTVYYVFKQLACIPLVVFFFFNDKKNFLNYSTVGWGWGVYVCVCVCACICL